MKLGAILPSFADTAEPSRAYAQRCADAGLDGVFAYDHLWPMNNPARPALAPFPLLGAIAQRHEGLCVGTLVARIGLVDDEVLIAQFRALSLIAPHRVIAAMGTGDKLSAQENLAYGVPFAPADERRAALEHCVRSVGAEGIEAWIGGGAAPTIELAERLGVTLNLWQADLENVRRHAQGGPVSWAGLISDDPDEAGAFLAGLADAGCTWAVIGGQRDPHGLSDLTDR